METKRMRSGQAEARQRGGPLLEVRTVPVQPGAGARPDGELVPWRGMVWVTWRQQRGLLASVLAFFAVAVAFMVIEGLKLHRDYATVTACHPAASPACQQLYSSFTTTEWHQGNGIRVALIAAPMLLALFAGPPVVARELETGTHRYAWTQGIGRVRWTIAKVAVLGSAITLAALILSQLFTWLFAPFLVTEQLTDLTPAVFDTQGTVYAAWALTGFCLGTFLGALIRHVLPAIAATLVISAALLGVTVGATDSYLHNHYPASTFWPMQLIETAWLLALCALLIAATVRQVRHHAT
jgi:hypothetical protein